MNGAWAWGVVLDGRELRFAALPLAHRDEPRVTITRCRVDVESGSVLRDAAGAVTRVVRDHGPLAPPAVAWVARPVDDRPALMCAAGAAILRLAELTPAVVRLARASTWKRAAVGWGNATAAQVREWAAGRAPTAPCEAADAVAVATAAALTVTGALP